MLKDRLRIFKSSTLKSDRVIITTIYEVVTIKGEKRNESLIV